MYCIEHMSASLFKQKRQMLKPPLLQLRSEVQTLISTPELEPVSQSQESIAPPQSEQHPDDMESTELLEPLQSQQEQEMQQSAEEQENHKKEEEEQEQKQPQPQVYVVDIMSPSARALSWMCQECDREEAQVLGVYCMRCIKNVKFCIRCGDLEPTHHRASRLRYEINATRLIYYCMPCAVRECNHREMMQMGMAAAHLPAAQLP